MATITFRTDPAVDQALSGLTNGDGDRSQAIRSAILSAWRLREDDLLRAEALALAGDPADVAESRAVLREMESLRAW